MTDLAATWNALRASWPPVSQDICGPFIWQDGAGGGNRVSAALSRERTLQAPAKEHLELERPISERDITHIEKKFEASQRQAVFQVHASDHTLAALLETRGYTPFDETLCLSASLSDMQTQDTQIQSVPKYAAHWPPTQEQKAIWSAGGIDQDRLNVMERAAHPKAALSLDGGTMFVAIHENVAAVHALEVAHSARRQGVARSLMACAVDWARAHDAYEMALLVTSANKPAQRLYSSLGMRCVGQYHYQRKGEF